MTERVSRRDYFRASFELLAIGGKPMLTTTGVCRRLGVTTGSLYHHFGSGAEFYRAVIQNWENTVIDAEVAMLDSIQDPYARLGVAEQMARNANYEAEKAIRTWALTDPMVASAKHRVDQIRHKHLTKCYIAMGFEPARADTLSRIGFSIIVGAQAIGRAVDRKRLAAALDEYCHWIYAAVPNREAASALPSHWRQEVSVS